MIGQIYLSLMRTEDEDRDGYETIVNGENNDNLQEDFQEEDDRGFAPSPPRSPSNSIESYKSVRI